MAAKDRQDRVLTLSIGAAWVPYTSVADGNHSFDEYLGVRNPYIVLRHASLSYNDDGSARQSS